MALDENQALLHRAYQVLLYTISMDDRGTMAARIKAARTKAGLTQRQLGDLVGVTPQAVSQWERNETAPEPTNYEQLARALRMSIDVLVMGPRFPVGLSEPGQDRYEIGDPLPLQEALSRLTAEMESRGLIRPLAPTLREEAALMGIWRGLSPAKRKTALRMLKALAEEEAA